MTLRPHLPGQSRVIRCVAGTTGTHLNRTYLVLEGESAARASGTGPTIAHVGR